VPGVGPSAPLGLGAAPALGGAGADKVALHVRQSTQHGNHEPPGAGAGVGPRLGERTELRLGVHDALNNGEQVEGAERWAVNAHQRSPRRRAEALE
jgi:hypothetical protein